MLKLSTKLYDEPTNPFEGYGIKECDELAKIYDDLSNAIERIYPKMNVWCIDPFIDYLNKVKEMHAQIDEFEKAKEKAIQKYNKVLSGEIVNASRLMYEYLDSDNRPGNTSRKTKNGGTQMKILKALLGTISLFAVAIFFTWIATLGTWGIITLFAAIFIAIFAVILSSLS